MLLSFRVVNHRSLRDEQQLNLAPAFDADRPEGTNWPAVPIAAIFGANASGKSNLIDALLYMRRMVIGSDRETEPGRGVSRSPFALDPDTAALESWFVIDAVLDGVRYTYGFGVDDSGVTEEWLHRYPVGRRQIVFERKDGDYRFGTTVHEELRRISKITPNSVLLMTSAARFQLFDVLPIYVWMRSLGAPVEQYRLFDSEWIATWIQVGDNRRRALELLKFADFGIVDVIVRMAGRHVEPIFEMSGARQNARLTFEEQSGGTRAFLTLLPGVLECLETGSVMVVDELESNLHPNLARHIVGLFQDPRTNPHAAQLIFTTHNTSLLGSNNEILKRDQIWFVEKGDQDGATNLFPLSDFKPRNRENTERRYLGGGYGAVPFIDDALAAEVLQSSPGRDDADAPEDDPGE
jgi:hypothetical protein